MASSVVTTQTAAPLGAPPGDVAVWIFIFAELLAFGVLFIVFGVARRADVEGYLVGQTQLDAFLGLVNTVLLITSSYLVAGAVRRLRRGRSRAAGVRLALAIALGVAFVLIKLHEYRHQFAAGLSLSDGGFGGFYLALTGFHFAHVLLGLTALTVVLVRAARGAYGAQDCNGAESAAAYWHMVDLLWLVLYPLIYVLH